MRSRGWKLWAIVVVATAGPAGAAIWHFRPTPAGYYTRIASVKTYSFRSGDLELVATYKRSVDRAPPSKERSLHAFRVQKAVFDHLVNALETGREEVLAPLEASFDLPARGHGEVGARVHAVAVVAERYFAGIAGETGDEETRRFIDIGVGMYRELARWTDPADHRLHEPILRQVSCSDLSWVGGSRYLLALAIRDALLEAPSGDAAATEALLELRLGPVLGFSCPPRENPLMAVVDLPRATYTDLARSGVAPEEGKPPAVLLALDMPPAVLLALDLLASVRDWTGPSLTSHPLRDAFAAFDRRLAEDLGARRLALPDGRSARVGGKGALVE